MELQITAYLSAKTDHWLEEYSTRCGLNRAEVVRLLVTRERRVKWLKWAVEQVDQPPTLRPKKNENSRTGARPQAVGYIDAAARNWLDRYAAELTLFRSDVVRLLLEREKQVQWIKWATGVDDPARSKAKPLRSRARPLPYSRNV